MGMEVRVEEAMKMPIDPAMIAHPVYHLQQLLILAVEEKEFRVWFHGPPPGPVGVGFELSLIYLFAERLAASPLHHPHQGAWKRMSMIRREWLICPISALSDSV